MASSRDKNPAPPGYSTPPFPSLYWLIGPDDVVQPKHLYHGKDIWRFTFFWTLIIYEAAHVAVGFYAVAMSWWGARKGLKPAKEKKGESSQRKDAGDGAKVEKLRVLWMIPILYAFVAGVEAVLAGSVVGLMLGAVYNSGGFTMSTWIPFVWSIISVLVLILSSFSIQGGL